MIPHPNRVLLDTHVFLWWNQEPELLSPDVTEILNNPDARLVFSVVTVWEIQIKVQVKKLAINYSLQELARVGERDRRVEVLPITTDHILALDTLPLLHKDPFDRLLIAQAKVEKIPLLTADAAITAYPISTLW